MLAFSDDEALQECGHLLQTQYMIEALFQEIMYDKTPVTTVQVKRDLSF